MRFPVKIVINQIAARLLQLLNIIILIPIQSGKLKFSVCVCSGRVVCTVPLYSHLSACAVGIEAVLGTAKLLRCIVGIHLGKL